MAGLGSSLKFNSPSAGPSAARIDHLNRQVAELVAQNKAEQARAASLEKSLQAERERAEQAMREVEAKWAAERGEWQDTVDFIQGAHEIAHLRTLDELHATRITAMLEQDRVLKERARAVRKEYNLTLSQAKERELERELALARDELELAREELQFELADATASEAQKLRTLKAKCAKLEQQKSLKTNELSKAIGQRETLERELDQLKSTHATLTANLESTQTKLERLTLKLDGAQNTQTELERKNAELKMSNKDLKQQLDKWQNLETKGGAEVDQLKRAKLELQARVKESDALLKDAEKKEKEQMRALQKEQKKVASLIVEREQLQDQLQQVQREVDDARRAAATVTKEAKRRARSPTTEIISETEAEAAPPPPPAKPKKRPRVQEVEVSDAEEEVRPVTKGKKRARTAEPEASDEEAERPRKRNDGRSKVYKTDLDDDRPPSRAKGKTKDHSRASQEPENRKNKQSSSSTTREKPRSSSKPPSSSKTSSSAVGKKAGPSKLAKDTIPEEPDEEPEPKKKRKIFLPATQAMTFDWTVPQQEGGLDIPTALSPIKESVPTKSFLSKVGSGLFGFGQ